MLPPPVKRNAYQIIGAESSDGKMHCIQILAIIDYRTKVRLDGAAAPLEAEAGGAARQSVQDLLVGPEPFEQG